MGPRAVMLVRQEMDTGPGRLDVEPVGMMPKLSLRIIPAHKQVAWRFDDLQGITEPSSNGDIEHWQRTAGAADPVDDRVNEDVAGVCTKAFWNRAIRSNFLPFWIVMDPALALKHRHQTQCAESRHKTSGKRLVRRGIYGCFLRLLV